MAGFWDWDDEAKWGCVLFVLFVLSLPLFFGGCYAGSKVQVSDGYRDSTIRKVSETGLIFKTVEVEGIGDGFRVQDGKGGAETFRYSVTDPDVITQLKTVPADKKVRIHYRKQLTTWVPTGESPYFITRIEGLK